MNRYTWIIAVIIAVLWWYYVVQSAWDSGLWIDAPVTSTAKTNTTPVSDTQAVIKNNTPAWDSVTTTWITVNPYLDTTIDGSDLRFDKTLATNSAYTRYQISYMSNGLRISGIMNIPTGVWPHPLVILNHGYIDPAVYTIWRWLKREQDYLARNWYAVLHTDYRNHWWSDNDQNLIDDSYLRSKYYGIDALNAIQAVRQAISDKYEVLNNVDADRVWMMGHSMWGGVTMYGLVAHPQMIQAAVLYAPVHSNEYYNFNRWMINRLSSAEYNALQDKLWPLDQIDTFASFSPETYFDRVQTPVQIYFGTNDASCPVQRGRDIRDQLTAADKSVELIEYPWEQHEFGPQWTRFMQWVVQFFDNNLSSTTQ